MAASALNEPSAHRGCSLCSASDVDAFYRRTSVPTNSCLTLDNRDEALDFSRGQIDLVFCAACGFVHNRAFEPRLTEYSERYVSTQTWSETFNAYQVDLADRLDRRFGLRGRRVVEIGCGRGEFLDLLSDRFGVEAIGVDPAAIARRADQPGPSFIADYLTIETATDLKADVLVCKMTLEHIADVRGFASMLRAVAANNPQMGLFVEVPDITRILEENAYWDIYYEHCNYFSQTSLHRLLSDSGFGAIEIGTEYGDQYLAAFADASAPAARVDATGAGYFEWQGLRFAKEVDASVRAWNAELSQRAAAGERIVLWGSGSKAVSFLGVLTDPATVDAVVDINPDRHGKFIAGTGHEIIAPARLVDLRPDCVVVMNRRYEAEIDAQLRDLGINAATRVLA